MINKIIAYKIFCILFGAFLISNIAELHLPGGFDLIPGIHFSDIPFLKYFLIFAFALLLIPLKEYFKILKEPKLVLVLSLLILLLMTGYTSAYFSEFPDTAYRVCNRISFYIFIFIICLTAVRYFEGAGEFILKAFIYSNVLIVSGSLLDFYSQGFHNILIKYFDRPEMIHSYIQIATEKIMRPMGFITDSNLAAFSVSLALLLLLLNHKHFNKIFTYVFYAAGSFVFGMLTSRGALIMCVICIVFFYFYKAVERKEIYLFVILFIIFQFITPQTYGRFLSYSDKEKMEEEFSVGRPAIWNAAITVFKENPVLGKGPGVFFEVSDRYIRNILSSTDLNITNPDLPKYHKIDKLNPHSIFLVMLAETGLIGFTLFLLLIASLIVIFFKDKKSISLLFLTVILFVSALSNFAPYYKYYLMICIVFYLSSNFNMQFKK